MTNPSAARETSSPDRHARGFLVGPVDAMRYDRDPRPEPGEVVDLLSSFIPRGARVLDVGCGSGSVSAKVAELTQARILGVEPDPERAARARQRGLEVLNELLTEELVQRLGRFDAVMFADVLEHLPDPFSLLKIAGDALDAGGAIVASVPNIAHWSVRADLLRGRFAYAETGIMDATHLRWFTETGIRLLFESAGFRVEGVAMTAGFDFPFYTRRWPWRHIPRWRRVGIVRRAIHWWPRLFGCQIVVRAVRVSAN